MQAVFFLCLRLAVCLSACLPLCLFSLPSPFYLLLLVSPPIKKKKKKNEGIKKSRAVSFANPLLIRKNQGILGGRTAFRTTKSLCVDYKPG